ncbi:MAG: HAMP domain-containing sensor histidine kinase [Pseudomonadota bacterium]
MQRPKQNVQAKALLHTGSTKGQPDLLGPLAEPASKAISEQGQFLYTVTHDMKASLRALTELPNWVEDDLQEANIQVPRQVQEHLHLMRRSASGLSTLLDGLLELSSVGRHPDAPRRSTVEQAARRAWSGLSKDDGFTLETHDALETIYLPERAVQTIFKSILENTIHHHDRSKSHVKVISRTAGNRVQIMVEDDGPGLEPGLRDLVFDALFTMRPRQATGRAGLGLTIARKLIIKLGGKIELTDASYGRGLAVHFDLPMRERR